MTSTFEKLYNFIVNKEHHKYRHTVDFKLSEEYSAKGISPIERMSDRFRRMCGEEKAVILEGEQIVFLRTVSNLPDIFTESEWAEIKAKHYIHELGYMSNLCPDYYDAISKGLLEKRKIADEYGKAAIDNIIMLSDKYLEEAKRQGREDLVEILTRVPRYPARNFREALQFFRILHYALWLEGNYHNTVGRFDKYMYPYLKADMEKGIYTEETALELLCDFFLSFNKDSDLYVGVQQGDNGQSMMLGGIDENGNDVYNLLSELCLKASYNNKLIDPKINLRVSKATPAERYTEATQLTKAGLGFPQYSNDDIVIPALEELGYEYNDAVNYTVAACWEFIIPNVGADIANISAMSYPKAVDIALHNNLEKSDSYDEFFMSVKAEIKKECDKIADGIKDLWFVPSPFMNVLMDCDIYNGGKYNNFGIHGTGIATAADSLAVIKKYVFEEKTIGKSELIKAVDENFENTPELLHKLRYEAPKLGNNDDFVDGIATELLDSFAEALEGKTNCRDGIYRAGTGSAMYYLWHADEIGASPDGRRAKEPLGTNFSVSLFANVKGPVSVIASMTKQHFVNAINGGPLTLEFHQSVFADDDGIEKVGLLVKNFIDRGGHQLQLNTVNLEKMLDAQKHPENYKQLVVRIWGWSAYFVELDKEYQDHVIARQAYSV
ncbi:MAG: pyruvate formate lyase family protein [Acutalibacteraceae bacterium]|nr:pyruvate formate lyase family protein [Acutalibacteraceae bacterium]